MKCCLEEADEENAFDYPVYMGFQTGNSSGTSRLTNEAARLVKGQLKLWFWFGAVLSDFEGEIHETLRSQ